MGEKHRYVDVKPYLPHALVATVGVLGIPFLAVIALTRTFEPDPNFLILVLAGIVATAISIGLGIALWKTRPESADIAFGELLIWGWLQRKRADDRLDEGVRLLGLDRSGHPTQAVRISPEDQLEVLKDLNGALEAKDPYTHGHSQRVERHSYRTAAAMGLSVETIEELRLAAALHDVGKIRVPDRILRKPSRLTSDERTIVEEHVVVGAWMVASVGSADVVGAVRHHHERWDGRGYPDGLAGTDIPLFARLIAVADAYDAITSTRPYRVSAGREHAVSVLRSEAGTQFDPMIVNAFIDALPVRLPVAGALILFAGPAAFGRKLAMWLKRVGAGHLAPAAATLGAVVTLGAFIPTPGLLPAQPPAVAAAPAAGAPAARPQAEVDRKPKAEPEPKADVRRPRAIVAHAPAATETRPIREVSLEGDIILGEDMVRPKPEPKEEPKRDPDPHPSREPEPEPDPEPADDEDDDDGSCSGESEKEGKGHEKAKGEGHSKHCD